MNTRFPAVAAAAFLFLTAPVSALAQTYAFGSETKFINISFESRMDIEDILGTTRSASGTVERRGESAKFEVRVPVESLRTGIDLRDEHLRSSAWLDAAQFPEITFQGDQANKTGADTYEITGMFTAHGVGKSKTVHVAVKQIPAATGKKLGLPPGNWLRVRSTFKVKLSEHGVKIPKTTVAKVSDEWTVNVSVFAQETR